MTRPRIVRVLLFAALAAIAGVALLGAALLVPAPRAALVKTVIGAYLWTKGFDLRGVDLRVGGGVADARGIVIGDRLGRLVLTADDVIVHYGARDRAAGISAIVVDRPKLFVYRDADGSFELLRLFGGGGGPSGAPLRASLAVKNGDVELWNASSPSPIGRHVVIDDLSASADIDQGSRSFATLTAVLVGARGNAPLRAMYREDDAARLAVARASVRGAPLGPIVDLFVSSHAFVIERASLDAQVSAYALDWQAGAGPDWHTVGVGQIRDATLRVFPLIAPFEHIAGPVRFADGVLEFPSLRGTAAGVAVATAGAVRLLGGDGPMLGLRIAADGRLSKIREWLAFSKPLPLDGVAHLQTLVRGPAADPHVTIALATTGPARYGAMPIDAFEADAYYHDQHLIVSRSTVGYDGASLYTQGDLDLTGAAPAGTIQAIADAPSSAIPELGDLDAVGRTRAFGDFSGPIAALEGSGFASVTGGPLRIRGALTSSAGGTSLASIVDGATGELVADGEIDRGAGGPAVAATAFAHRFDFRSSGRRIALPGIKTRVDLPAMRGVIDGRMVASGALPDPTAAVELHVGDLAVGGAQLGSVRLGAAGGGGRDYTVRNLAVQGAGFRLDSSGRIALVQNGSRGQPFGGTLVGRLRADLSRSPLPLAASSGTVDANIAGEFAGNQWLGSITSTTYRGRIAGIPFDRIAATIGSSGGAMRVYGAVAHAAGGDIAAVGSMPPADTSRPSGRLLVTASDVDVSSLPFSGLPVRSGIVNAIAELSGTSAHPVLAAAGTLDDGSALGRQIFADADLTYSSGTLRADDARVAIDGSQIDVRGTVNGIDPNRPTLGGAQMALRASMPAGDLASLTAGLAPSSIPLTGDAQADLEITGSPSSPYVAGDVAVGSGTLRGVPFDDLRAGISGGLDSMAISDASVQLGESHIAAAGSIAPGSYRLRVRSPSLDLDDFNDFFGGKDVMDGMASVDVALVAEGGRARADGTAAVRGAMAYQVPLGAVDVRLTSLANGAHVAARQRGPLMASTFEGDVLDNVGAVPSARIAYDVSRIDLGGLAPHAHLEDRGIAGNGTVRGRVAGPLDRPIADATFGVTGGSVAGERIDALSGRFIGDRGSLAVPSLTVAVDGARMSASGRLSSGGAIQGRAHADIYDLAKVARMQQRPLSMKGSATADLTARGTLRAPEAAARMTALDGEVQGVNYHTVSLEAAYQPGLLAADTAIDLGASRGSLQARARLPMHVSTAGVGLDRRPIALDAAADGLALQILDPFLGGKSAVSGALSARVAVRGNASQPRVYGDLQVRDGVVRSSFETVPLTGVTTDVKFDRDSITIDDARAQLGSGAVALSGEGHVVPATAVRPRPSLQYSARLYMRGAQLQVPNFFSGTVNAALTLTKSGRTPYLAGDVALSNTTVPFASILAAASASGAASAPEPGSKVPGLPALRPGHVVVYGGSIFGDDTHVLHPQAPGRRRSRRTVAILPRRLDLGLQVDAGSNVGVTGLVNVTGSGSVAVAGSTDDPQLSGTLTASRGQAGFLNTTFRLVDGTLTFDPADRFLPSVDAEAVTSTDTADITVTMSGRVDHLTTTFDSDPEMSQDAIIATLLHIPQINSALQQSQGIQQSQLGVSPGNVVSGALAGELLGSLNVGLEQFFNLGEVDFAISPTGRPTLEVRKQVGPRVFSVYRTTFDVPPAQTFGIDYLLRHAVQIELTQTQATPGLLSTYSQPQTALSVRVQFH